MWRMFALDACQIKVALEIYEKNSHIDTVHTMYNVSKSHNICTENKIKKSNTK